ncbi:hypothetical protein [Neobacillus soli]|uniref:hypothetical protein n=1 Tax=Neobacillus soli TaxID=220688 RepID=UPI00082454C3|nr:hypothetical protein [Neobacillus soli]
MIMIAPFLIILVIVIVAFMAIFMKKSVNKKGKYVYSNRVRWIVGGYLAVLLICAGIDMVHPFKGMADLKKVNTEKLNKESTDLYDAAVAGRIDTVDSKYIDKKWDLSFEDQKLNIAVENDEYFYTQIFVDRKNSNDDKIEAIFYKTRASANGMDITKLTHPIRLELAGNTLFLKNPKKVKLEFTTFNNVFTVNQFTGEDSLFSHHSEFSGGQSILYLRIPKDLQLIDKSNLNLEYVE